MVKNDPKTINEVHYSVKAHIDMESGSGLRSMWIEIPDHCQLHCSYCFANTSRNKPHLALEHLKSEEYISLLRDFKQLGGQFLGIPGNGESFHPDNRELVMKLLRYAKEIKLRTTVFTTGEAIFWNMDPEKTYAENLSSDPDFALMDELNDLDVILLIKFNSLIPEVQDRLVSQEGYTDARTKAMNWLINKYKMNDTKRLGIVTSIMPENRDEIENLYLYAKNNNLIFDCDTILPRGRGKDFVERETHLTDQDCRAIYKNLDKIASDDLCRGGSYVGVSCDRIKHHLYFDIYGNAYTCIGCVGKEKELVLGNIRKQSLKEIWDNTIRVQMRDNLKEIVLGPCSFCDNFQVSCFTCLGRSVDHFEFIDGQPFIHTKGCFNHRPNLDKWLQKYEIIVANLLSNIPEELTTKIKDDFYSSGMEKFWRQIPNILQQRGEIKDLCFSDLNFSERYIWNIFSIPQTLDEYDKSLETLLPLFILSSLKRLSMYESSFEPSSKGLDNSNFGNIQFTNIKFYMPHKKTYFYRTLSQNSFDPGILDLPEYRYFKIYYPTTVDKLKKELLLRNRKAILMQRWAEPFCIGEPALILKHIKNISRIFEFFMTSATCTYEFILSEQLFNEEKGNIYKDIHEGDIPVIVIHPLLNNEIVKSKVKNMNAFVLDLVSKDEEWERKCGNISEISFSDDNGFGELRIFYEDLAKIGFYPIENKDLNDPVEMESKIKDILREILSVNLGKSMDLHKFWIIHWGNEKQKAEIKCEFIGSQPETEQLHKRINNELLKQFILMFLSKEDGTLKKDWPATVNYFIWLGFFREYLGINSYFTHHVLNLRRHYRIFLTADEEKEAAKDSTPSGFHIFSTKRLSYHNKHTYRNIFTRIMNPLEEIIQTEYITSDMKKLRVKSLEKLIKIEAEKKAVIKVLIHYGHTFLRRFTPLKPYLNVSDAPSYIKILSNSISDLTLILQLYGVDDRDDLLITNEENIFNDKGKGLPKIKQERFLDLKSASNVNSCLDILLKLREWSEGFVFQENFILPNDVDSKTCNVKIEFEQTKISIVRIGFNLRLKNVDGVQGDEARLKENIYRELFFELLDNALRYGKREYPRIICNNYESSVKMLLTTATIIAENETIYKLLVMRNEVATERYDRVEEHINEGWARWTSFKGPGMSIDLFRRLTLGDMFYRVRKSQINGRLFFEVGLYLDGMEIITNDKDLKEVEINE